MARIQQSIDIGVPVHVAYRQLAQFEDYPRFMQDVETVHRIDDTHLHWSAKMSYQPLEWDSEIVERIPDKCIAWRNTGGPLQEGKMELQPAGEGKARVTMTVECDPAQVPSERHGNPEQMVALRVEDDLARFKQFIEAHGSGTGEGRPSDVQAGQSTQSAAALTPSTEDLSEEGDYPVAEEQNFDQQSDQARRVGQMPLDFGEAMSEAAKPDDKNAAGLKQSIERSVPPSE